MIFNKQPDQDAPSWSPGVRRGRRMIGLLGVVLLACGIMAMVALAGKLGAQAGVEQYLAHATATTNAQIVDWFLRGVDELQKGNYPLAEANFTAVLKAQPNNTGVQELIATARVAQTPTAVPATSTTEPTPVIADKASLFDTLKNANANQQWDTVINVADQLSALDGNYESATIADMRYNALVARATIRLNEGDIEAGLYDLDVASTIRALSPQVQQQRQVASMYQNAVNYFGADWDKAIQLLTQLYAAAPRYRDVAVKLLQAYERSGDAYVSTQQWCLAETHYNDAVAIAANTRLTLKQSDAHTRCLTATPAVITGTSISSSTLQNIPGLSGSIVFAAVDPASGAYRLQSFNVSRFQLFTLEVGGSQPAYQHGSGFMAYSYGSAIHGLSSNGSVVSLASYGGSWPSMSPDGTRLAYAQYQGGNWYIYINSLIAPTPPVKLTQGSHPVWGPNGRIAYEGCVNSLCGIYIVNPDQPEERQRITTSAGDISIQWSSDGNRLVYMTNFTGNWEIYTVALSNLQFRQITSGSGISGVPAFSPDGASIAFESNRDGVWGLYVVNSDGGDARKVLTLGISHPAWQSERLAWIP